MKQRVDDIETNVKNLDTETIAFYARWKTTSTSHQKNIGLREYEQMKRSSEFRQAEMNKMKEEFTKAAKKEGPHDRLNAEQYREWFNAMNVHNKSKGRWVDEQQLVK